jgi:GT2 family glycosyltransferase
MGTEINSQIDVSIIIVNYNKFSLLSNCLNSIYKHSKEISFEVIVVDNNSTEGDVEKIISNYPNLSLIKNETNRGFAAANNQGLKIAQGKFILFLNNDTVFIENTIKKLIDFLEEKDEMTLVGCKLLNEDLSHQVSIVDFDDLWNLIGENFFMYLLFPKNKMLNRYHHNYKIVNEPIEVDVVKGAFIFGYTKALKEIGGFDEKFFFYSEENDLCFRFKQRGGKVFYFPGTSIIHLGGASTDAIPWFMFMNLSRAKIQFFQKHFKGLKFILALIIHFTGIFIRVPLYFILGIVSLNKNLIKKSFYFFRLLFVYPSNSFK